MADGGDFSEGVVFVPTRGLRLSDGLCTGRHLRARCLCCGQRAPFIPDPSFLAMTGDALLADLYDRFRCFCGGRQAKLEIWRGPAPLNEAPLRVFLFH